MTKSMELNKRIKHLLFHRKSFSTLVVVLYSISSIDLFSYTSCYLVFLNCTYIWWWRRKTIERKKLITFMNLRRKALCMQINVSNFTCYTHNSAIFFLIRNKNHHKTDVHVEEAKKNFFRYCSSSCIESTSWIQP